MNGDAWETFNRVRWHGAALGLKLFDDEIRKLGDKYFAGAADASVHAQWNQIKQASETEGRPISEICDELVEKSDNVPLILAMPKFTRPRETTSDRGMEETSNRLELLRQEPAKYIQALEWLIFHADEAALFNGEKGMCDGLSRNTQFQSVFCAAVLAGIRKRKSAA